MTDEQLRAMARRVLGLVSEVVLDGRPCYVGYRDSLSFTRPIEEVDAEAVAILREEIDRANDDRTHPAGGVSKSFQAFINKVQAEELEARRRDPLRGQPYNDDPTKSFVATT